MKRDALVTHHHAADQRLLRKSVGRISQKAKEAVFRYQYRMSSENVRHVNPPDNYAVRHRRYDIFYLPPDLGAWIRG